MKTAVKIECPYCKRKITVNKATGMLRQHVNPSSVICAGTGMPAFLKQDRFSGREDLSRHE